MKRHVVKIYLEYGGSKGRLLFCAALFLGVQSCVPAPRGNDSVQSQTRLIGKLHVFEDSYFEALDGKAYDLKVVSSQDQDAIARLARRGVDRAEVCLKLSLIGVKTETSDNARRAVLRVDRVLSATRVDCSSGVGH